MMGLPTYYKSPHKIAGIDTAKPVLVALSGGADSTSLLYNLVEDAKNGGFKVFAAHINHNIRLDGYGNEALRDENFCRELCRCLGVELFIKSVDVPAISRESGESIEGAARRVRYEFFSEVMDNLGIPLLVTAHNATDNLETQIFNLCRGSGVSGMSGIPERRSFGEGKMIVRPILSGEKSEILGFCEKNGIKFVTDSTNGELDATRNKIRNIILPELEKIFPTAQRAGARLAESAAQTADYMESQAQEYLLGVAALRDDEITFSVLSFNSLHVALRGAVIMSVSERFGISLQSIHIKNAISLIERSVAHSSVDFPCGLTLKIEDGKACFSTAPDEVDELKYELPFDGKYLEIQGSDFCVVAGKENLSAVDNKTFSLYASAVLKGNDVKDGIVFSRATVRSRREGDKIIDGGNTKKLKKLMCDKKVPIDHRSILPLICLDGNIVYAPRCAICDNAKKIGEDEIEIFIFKKL